jgi:hypothetical protein
MVAFISLCHCGVENKNGRIQPVKRSWKIIADKLSKAGWNLGWVSAVDSEGRTIWIVDAHRDDGKRFVVHADEKLTAGWCVRDRRSSQKLESHLFMMTSFTHPFPALLKPCRLQPLKSPHTGAKRTGFSVRSPSVLAHYCTFTSIVFGFGIGRFAR